MRKYKILRKLEVHGAEHYQIHLEASDTQILYIASGSFLKL